MTTFKGYQPKPQANIDIVNKNKELEEQVLQAIDLLPAQTNNQYDPRWAAIARTHIELGFMAINRAILKPKRPSEK